MADIDKNYKEIDGALYPKEDWKVRLVEINEKHMEAAKKESTNRKEAQNWVMDRLTPTLRKLGKTLDKLPWIDSVSKEPTTPLGDTLKFKVINIITPVFLSYSVRLEFSSLNVKGHTKLELEGKEMASKLRMPEMVIYADTYNDILDWDENKIINDFLTGFGCWGF